jgi:hypothetical protein
MTQRSTAASEGYRGRVFSRAQREVEGAQFDEALAVLKDAFAKQYPSEPFEVDGRLTPRAMHFIKGYVAGLRAILG